MVLPQSLDGPVGRLETVNFSIAYRSSTSSHRDLSAYHGICR